MLWGAAAAFMAGRRLVALALPLRWHLELLAASELVLAGSRVACVPLAGGVFPSRQILPKPADTGIYKT